MLRLLGELETAARLLESAELETTTRQGRATVNWSGPYSVTGAIGAGRGRKGLYVIYRNGTVVDSGKADVQDLATRIAQHFEYPLRHQENLQAYRIRLGVVRRASAVNLAEGVLTRSLAKRGLIPTNRSSLFAGRKVRVPNTAPFLAGVGGVRISHRGRMPKGLRSFTTRRGGRAVQAIRQGQIFEFLPPYLQSEAGFESELDRAGRALEAPEPFYTRVTPIPGIGNKEGHEILTRVAMRGLALSAADRSAVLLGVIRPDRGGKSYWNFPRSALESLKARAQPAHSLRPTPSSTVATALRLIRARFVRLYLRAMRARNRATALQWLGEAMHLLQDSFSSAHVERAGGTGRIRHIRAFYVRFGWPPLSRAPREHNAPSDPRDDVYLNGALRREARAAIRASRVFLRMALHHLRVPGSPRRRVDLLRFMSRYLS
jgi:hypothetical protein